MGSGQLKAVADAGPLIHLAEIGCLRFLSGFDSIHIPDAVWLETVAQGRISHADLDKLHNIQRHSLTQSEVTEFVKKSNLSYLHVGERECFFICLNNQIPTLMTDDMAVRDAARNLDIVPVGSLGIVISAFKRGEIELHEAERHITDLYEVSSLFVTHTIVELAIERLRSSIK